MAKTRLLQADRDAIRDAVIDHKFTPVMAALDAEEASLASEARVRAYGDYLKVVDVAPEGAFAEEDSVNINAGGKRLRLRFGTFRRVFANHGYYNPILSLPDTDSFAVRVADWAAREDQARADKNHLRSVTNGTLAAFRTFDDLLTAWPEAEPFIKARWQTRPEYAAYVPAVQIADLSRQLDLPPETLAQAA